MSQPPSSSAEIGSHTGKCCGQCHYREVPRCTVVERVYLTQKKISIFFGPRMFSGANKNVILKKEEEKNNILASALKSCII